MSTRVRYDRTNESLLSSRQIFVGSNGEQLQAVINTDTMEVVVNDVSENVNVRVERAKTLQSAKKLAKQMLESLGVGFSSESRNRTNSNQMNGESNEKSTNV